MKAGEAAANDETVVHNKSSKLPPRDQHQDECDKTVVASNRPALNPELAQAEETAVRTKAMNAVAPSDDDDDDAKTLIQPPKKTLKSTVKDDRLSMSTMQLARRSLSGDMAIAQNAYLEVYGLKSTPVGFDLNDKEFLIGRNQDCHLILPLYGVSRVHSRIYFMNDEYYIEDMNSTNGTYVNGIKILKCVLRNNDQIEIGEAKIIFIEERMRRVSK